MSLLKVLPIPDDQYINALREAKKTGDNRVVNLSREKFQLSDGTVLNLLGRDANTPSSAVNEDMVREAADHLVDSVAPVDGIIVASGILMGSREPSPLDTCTDMNQASRLARGIRHRIHCLLEAIELRSGNEAERRHLYITSGAGVTIRPISRHVALYHHASGGLIKV